jgi:prepilin-type N-terminal cleavage/methylation domain-containing protein/prepilin-type processing-associated H-X9-DG protein
MRRPSGFTLIELLVVVGIISILVGLLLPAIQSARESVRRAHCANNLMQLGVALGSYASTHRVFPPGVVDDSGPIRNLPVGYHHGWVVQILPFIGEANLYHHFDMRESVYEPSNDTAAEVKIATLLCPSAAGSGPNYAGCHHDENGPIASDNRGVLYLNSKVSYADITDGPAYTILLGEIENDGPSLGWVSGTRSTLRNTGVPLNEPNPASVPTGATATAAGASIPASVKAAVPRAPGGKTAKAALVTGPSRTETLEIVLSLAEGGAWPVELAGGFSSAHVLAANFLMCDGSVRPIKQSISRSLYRHLGNRADGEMIDSERY